MTEKKYYWLKLKDTFFRDKEMKKLRKIAGGDTYTIIYLKLQLLSLKNEGKLLFENLEDTFAEEMALEIDEEADNVKITLTYLKRCGLIEEVSENEFLLLQTIECIGKETSVAARVRKSRNNKNLLQSNAPVTKCNTEIEIEIEIDKDMEIEGRLKKKKYADRVLLLEDEYEKLINQYSKFIIDNKIIDLDLWKGGKGKSTKSDYLTLLAWLRKDIKGGGTTGTDSWGYKPKDKIFTAEESAKLRKLESDLI